MEDRRYKVIPIKSVKSKRGVVKLPKKVWVKCPVDKKYDHEMLEDIYEQIIVALGGKWENDGE